MATALQLLQADRERLRFELDAIEGAIESLTRGKPQARTAGVAKPRKGLPSKRSVIASTIKGGKRPDLDTAMAALHAAGYTANDGKTRAGVSNVLTKLISASGKGKRRK